MLRANNIAPRQHQHQIDIPEQIPHYTTPTSTSSGKRKQSTVKEEESVDELDADEVELRKEEAELKASLTTSLLRRLQLIILCSFIQARLEKITKAREAKNREKPAKKVKREQKPVFLPGEVIDLTI